MNRQPRDTSRAIIIKDDNILMIERWRDDLHYFSIPGGGIEKGETPEQAVAREVTEETSLRISVVRQLYEVRSDSNTHYFYLCEYQSGEPHLPANSEEAQAGPHNRFKPLWLPISELGSIKVNPIWEPVHKMLMQDLQIDFSKSVKITAV